MIPSGINMDLYEPFERLVEIEVLGQRVGVPENNTLLRGFQFLSTDTISNGRFCWNNQCGNCHCEVAMPGEAEPAARRACCTTVAEGMRVVATSKFVKLQL